MPDYTVISDVSLTLCALLEDALHLLDPLMQVQSSDLQDANTMKTHPAHLTLFLFEIIEDPSARNRPHVRQVQAPNIIVRKPPMALLLRYMVTPWSEERATDQKILGRVLETLYDGAIISGTKLQGKLLNTDVSLKINLAPITLEDRTRVWHSVQKPYRLSLTYEVRVVNIDASAARQVAQVQGRTIVPHMPEDS